MNNTAEQLDNQSESVIETQSSSVITLTDFIQQFGSGLMQAVQAQNPPIFDGTPSQTRELLMDKMLRSPFDAQRGVIQSVSHLLIDRGLGASIINGEMGTGKTLMSIVAAAILDAEGFKRTLVISPPHLVYKWRREIMDTVPDAKVWVLNGPDTLAKLLAIRDALGEPESHEPEFFVIGRVRMRMGFNWKSSIVSRKRHVSSPVSPTNPESKSIFHTHELAACPDCGTVQCDEDGNSIEFAAFPQEKQMNCSHCYSPLWTLIRAGNKQKSRKDIVSRAMQQIPTIGPKSAENLLNIFGENLLGSMLADNIYEFVNLMDDNGELVFSDRQARRIEKALAKLEFGFGQGGYQPTEFIKRYIPKGYFSNLLVDEAHEYKNQHSAQGQAMGVLSTLVKKTILLTGTLMGGYADDIFYLLWRAMPQVMLQDGYRYNNRNTLSSAAMSFMREHGVLKDIYKESEIRSHRTARGKSMTVRTVKAPGFGPKGIARFVLPYTAFLKLRDIGQNVLPPYREHFIEVDMTSTQGECYVKLKNQLETELRQSLARGDTTLLGVVLNVLLRWPDTCFNAETVKHPRSHSLLAFMPSVFDEDTLSPKEKELIRIALDNKGRHRRTLVYTTYTGKRDTASRLKTLLTKAGLKTAVLRSSVSTMKREDWILDQVDRGIDCMVCNPELVKTGLDLLEFPTIVFMQSGYNVYTLQQASRRSWRIGQTEDVDVYYLGYANSAQITCLSLMAKKIAVSQSTSGDVPDTGLDILNQDGDSVEVALAKQLLK
ncbi:DEAD/DEAH box helicase [sulfur-oxidizing endosymbiont of Gigantopelta aegis]|uniref:DEAD/DEAH box helicase n=1 Tax=sulfur-oxidizing endosymbiont of Gigantopelta aegis TaxID=2794934 RepID=UPI001FE69E39|nr:DEAD/DEAH box helicase [sulfur-oxidizing endosymbiont of Gigantopelta aegis]